MKEYYEVEFTTVHYEPFFIDEPCTVICFDSTQLLETTDRLYHEGHVITKINTKELKDLA